MCVYVSVYMPYTHAGTSVRVFPQHRNPIQFQQQQKGKKKKKKKKKKKGEYTQKFTHKHRTEDEHRTQKLTRNAPTSKHSRARFWPDTHTKCNGLRNNPSEARTRCPCAITTANRDNTPNTIRKENNLKVTDAMSSLFTCRVRRFNGPGLQS